MFKKVNLDELNENWVKKIHHEWALIVTNDTDKVNAMTANWIQMGWLWNKNTASSAVKSPQTSWATAVPWRSVSTTAGWAFGMRFHRKNPDIWAASCAGSCEICP